MKNIIRYIPVALLVFTLVACKKDNYEAPTSMLSGALLYNKDTVYVEYDRVPYQLFQYGFGKVGPISGAFTQEGTYSSLLFDGTYKFTIQPGQGPFKWKEIAPGVPDSLDIEVRGNTIFDIAVTPYYMIDRVSITASGRNVSANFGIAKIVTDADEKDVERVNLYINKTQFVSGTNDYNITSAELNGTDITDLNTISLTAEVPEITPTQNYAFARVGLKIVGVEDMMFSKVIRINL